MRWARSSWSSFFYSWNASAPLKRYHFPKELRAKGIGPPRSPSVDYRVALVLGSAFLGISLWGIRESKLGVSSSPQGNSKGVKKVKGPKKHFLEFASIEIDGEFYMTPQDFIESMVKNRPSLQIMSKLYSVTDVKEINACLPSIHRKNVFSTMEQEGILSFEDYLFLSSLLTKSQSAFESAFRLLDQNGNDEIDIKEFRNFCLMTTKRQLTRDKLRTSLSVLFFGEDGSKKLSWRDFTTFLRNFQREILAAEFNQYLPRHSNTISESNFARIILRHSDFTNEVYSEYMNRIHLRLHPIQRKGVTFYDFETFSRLLNHIDDLCIAVRMINFAGIPMNKKEFSRAVNICLPGEDFSSHMIDVIFLIFDIEGDSLLSYDEFLSVAKRMQLRKRRPDYLKKTHTQKFKHCLREELTSDFYGPSDF